MSGELPKGWIVAQVKEVIHHCQPGFASGKKDVEGGLAHLRMNNIGLAGELVLDLVRRVPKQLASPAHTLHRGDVLVCTTNSGKLVGKCAYFDLPGQYAFSNHITRLRPRPSVVDGRFLRWTLWLHWQCGTFNDKCKHWVNQSTLPRDALLGTEIPLAPLTEQRRIVAKLETLLNKVDACKERLAKIPILLKRFRQAVLAAACSGKLTADWRPTNSVQAECPQGWTASTIGDVVADIRYGTAARCSYDRRGVPVLRIPNVVSGRIDPADLKFAELPARERERLRLQPGDVLVIRSNGSVSLVGRSAIVDEKQKGWAYAGYLIRLRPIRTKVEPDFLNLALASYDVRLQIEVEARSTSGVHNINSEELQALRFIVPPVTEQEEIVRRVDALFAVTDQIQARFERAREQVEKLTPALLARAFRGELVPQDPNDEPASALLARIRAKRDL